MLTYLNTPTIRTWERFLDEKTNVRYSFSSTQVNLPSEISKKIIDWGKKNIKDEDVYQVGNKFGRENEIHVTVLYGLHDDSPNSIRRLIEKEPPVELSLGDITAFTNNEEFDVIKITVISPDLHRIHKKIKSNAKFTNDYPKYQPHCTIAYVKNNTSSNYVGKDPFNGEKIKLDYITFSSKNGTKTKIKLKGTPHL